MALGGTKEGTVRYAERYGCWRATNAPSLILIQATSIAYFGCQYPDCFTLRIVLFIFLFIFLSLFEFM